MNFRQLAIDCAAELRADVERFFCPCNASESGPCGFCWDAGWALDAFDRALEESR